jgi:hypothetical protein
MLTSGFRPADYTQQPIQRHAKTIQAEPARPRLDSQPGLSICKLYFLYHHNLTKNRPWNAPLPVLPFQQGLQTVDSTITFRHRAPAIPSRENNKLRFVLSASIGVHRRLNRLFPQSPRPYKTSTAQSPADRSGIRQRPPNWVSFFEYPFPLKRRPLPGKERKALGPKPSVDRSRPPCHQSGFTPKSTHPTLQTEPRSRKLGQFFRISQASQASGANR